MVHYLTTLSVHMIRNISLYIGGKGQTYPEDESNQYPSAFYEPLIRDSLTRIVVPEQPRDKCHIPPI